MMGPKGTYKETADRGSKFQRVARRGAANARRSPSSDGPNLRRQRVQRFACCSGMKSFLRRRPLTRPTHGSLLSLSLSLSVSLSIPDRVIAIAETLVQCDQGSDVCKGLRNPRLSGPFFATLPWSRKTAVRDPDGPECPVPPRPVCLQRHLVSRLPADVCLGHSFYEVISPPTRRTSRWS